MQIDPVALELDVQLDLAVLIAAGPMASASASRRSRCRAANMSRTVIRREERTTPCGVSCPERTATAGRLSETPARVWQSRQSFSETTSWTPS